MCRTDEKVAHKGWVVYILEAGDGTLYTGITTDPERRLREHGSGGSRAAKYLKSRLPVKILYTENQPDRSRASQREAAIKKMRRQQKQALIRSADDPRHENSRDLDDE